MNQITSKVLCAILNNGDRLLMERPNNSSGHWSMPTTGVDLDEFPIDAFIRHLQAAYGLTALLNNCLKVDEYTTEATGERVEIYLCYIGESLLRCENAAELDWRHYLEMLPMDDESAHALGMIVSHIMSSGDNTIPGTVSNIDPVNQLALATIS